MVGVGRVGDRGEIKWLERIEKSSVALWKLRKVCLEEWLVNRVLCFIFLLIGEVK